MIDRLFRLGLKPEKSHCGMHRRLPPFVDSSLAWAQPRLDIGFVSLSLSLSLPLVIPAPTPSQGHLRSRWPLCKGQLRLAIVGFRSLGIGGTRS